jgi:hypothetical protein
MSFVRELYIKYTFPPNKIFYCSRAIYPTRSTVGADDAMVSLYWARLGKNRLSPFFPCCCSCPLIIDSYICEWFLRPIRVPEYPFNPKNCLRVPTLSSYVRKMYSNITSHEMAGNKYPRKETPRLAFVNESRFSFLFCAKTEKQKGQKSVH